MRRRAVPVGHAGCEGVALRVVGVARSDGELGRSVAAERKTVDRLRRYWAVEHDVGVGRRGEQQGVVLGVVGKLIGHAGVRHHYAVVACQRAALSDGFRVEHVAGLVDGGGGMLRRCERFGYDVGVESTGYGERLYVGVDRLLQFPALVDEGESTGAVSLERAYGVVERAEVVAPSLVVAVEAGYSPSARQRASSILCAVMFVSGSWQNAGRSSAGAARRTYAWSFISLYQKNGTSCWSA